MIEVIVNLLKEGKRKAKSIKNISKNKGVLPEIQAEMKRKNIKRNTRKKSKNRNTRREETAMTPILRPDPMSLIKKL